MTGADLVDRLAALPNLAPIPRNELEWLVAHGDVEVHDAGTVLAPKGVRIEKLWIILSGHIAVRVDRGVGPRRVIDWRAGEVSGMLPFSRMTGPPGDNYLEARSELLAIHERHFPAMITECPRFTAYTVHLMLDRARSFNTSDLHDEKMVALGKLAAGLAHELNNPAAAAVRSAKLLVESLIDADRASREFGRAGLADPQIARLEAALAACRQTPEPIGLSPLEQADRHEALADWLDEHGVDTAYAGPLAEASVTPDVLNTLTADLSAEAREAAVRWLATSTTTHALASGVERATARIHELVNAVRRFTYMDHLAAPELIHVDEGLRDTIQVLGSKVADRQATVTIDVEPDLPRVRANGGELNQVWMNLLDNALDAIGPGGHVAVAARRALDRVVVTVVDDGPGVPEEIQARIFDPFFTTKPPGQGTGLGLDLARRLVRRYRGEITVESRPGQTTFSVSLPVETGGA